MRNNPIIFLFRKLWEYSAGNRRMVVVYIALFVCAGIVHLIEPIVVGTILNVIQERGLSRESLPSILGLMAILPILSVGFWAFHGPARVVEMKNAFWVRLNYKRYLVEGTMELPAAWHTDHHSGDTIDKIEKGTRALYEFSEGSFLIIGAVLSLVGSYIALAYFNIHSTYIVVLLTALTFFMITVFDRTLIRQYKELNRADNRVSEKIYDVVSNITTVIILRIEKLVAKAIVQKMAHPWKLYVASNKLNEVKWFLVSVASSMMVFFVVASYVIAVVGRGEAVLIGTIYVLFGYVQKINNMFFRFAEMYSNIVRRRTAVANAEELSQAFAARKRARQISLAQSWREIQVRDLQFTYHTDEGADLHLDGVSFAIRRGEKIAFIGESGSGKTTALKIIRELYQPQHIAVLLDGKLLPHGFASISESISLIPQEPELFATTVRENITMGVEHKLSNIKRFTDIAKFTDVALRLPHGFESSIVEKGVNLSGGEKQRLALARGLLASSGKSILLMDEPTSSVDLATELTIFRNIFGHFRTVTIISSVHRLHLLPLFDSVYLFSTGKIIASGTFSELQKSSRPFVTLWKQYVAAERKQA